MSLLAFIFLTLSITCALLVAGAELPGSWPALAGAGAVVFGILFLGAMLIGRRIKFDPALR